MRMFFIIVLILGIVNSCASSPYRKVLSKEVIETPYVSFKAPNQDWFVHKDIKKIINNKKANLGIHAQLNKTSYKITLKPYPFKWMPIEVLFDKDGDYEARNIRGKYNPKNISRRLEQGIYYNETWVTYIQGLKCNGTVFSRSAGGLLKDIKSKNYAIGCGYYHKTEGKRILRVGYRYSYAGGKVRHQGQTKINKPTSREQAENYLKQTVAELISTIKIKDIDWDKMKGEGLIHENKSLDMSAF